MKKLEQAIDSYQKRNKVSKYNREDKYYLILGVGVKNWGRLLGFIKTLSLNLETGKADYTLTANPEEAFHVSNNVSSMLYHYLPRFNPRLQCVHYFPVKNKPAKIKSNETSSEFAAVAAQ